MDVARFIPCLVKTVNSALRNAREHWDANKEKLETMDFLPETMCPNGERLRMHNLYGTNVEIRYDDLFIPCMQDKPTGITLLVSFEVDGFLHNFRFTTVSDDKQVQGNLSHMFYCKMLQINKYLETLEKINETFTNIAK